MEFLDMNNILDRNKYIEEVKSFIKNFDTKEKGLYLYGTDGCGKTKFIKTLLKKLGYNTIYYDNTSNRNKSDIVLLNNNITTNVSVMDSFNRIKKNTIIIFDDIKNLIINDKSGYNELIKLIRYKKTKKQKLEIVSDNPIIFIGNNIIDDKKIKGLMDLCKCIKLNSITKKHIKTLFDITKITPLYPLSHLNLIIEYVDYDLRKFATVLKLINIDKDIIYNIINHNNKCNLFIDKEPKHIINYLYNNNVNMNKYNMILINESYSTILGLLWHENIHLVINDNNFKLLISIYKLILDNICYCDYIDRQIFKNQIWYLNIYNSIIKLYYNNYLLHKYFIKNKKQYNILFTKVLTKYSTEYNNFNFLLFLSQSLSLNYNDIMLLFVYLKQNNIINPNNSILQLESNYNINKLNLDRIYKYIDNIFIL